MDEKDRSGLTSEKLLASLPGFTDTYAEVNGFRLHYVRGGSGHPLILLPGWPQTWWAYHKIMPKLAESFDVIVVDIRGMGNSEKPASGFDKKTMASDIAALINQLALGSVHIAGHDIGAAVAFSLAANYPAQVSKLILIDLLHPEESVAQLSLVPSYGTFDGFKLNPEAPYLWWWAFLQVKGLAEQLMEGRSHLLYEWFFDNGLGNKEAMTAFDRSVFYSQYASQEAIRAANAWFQAFSQDIEDQKAYPQLELPLLGVGGSAFGWMSAVLPSKAKNLEMVHATNSGHFPVDEEPEFTSQAIIDFLKK